MLPPVLVLGFEGEPTVSFEYKADFLWRGALFYPTHSSFYDSMWSKFNALFVVYPVGHFTVGWVGKGMVTILCCIGTKIRSTCVLGASLHSLYLVWYRTKTGFCIKSICAKWKQLTMRWNTFFIVCIVPNPDSKTPLFAFPWQLPETFCCCCHPTLIMSD